MKEKNYLVRFLYYVIVAVLLYVIIVSFCYPENNLLPIPMIFATVIGFVAVIFGCWLWRRMYSRLRRWEPYLYYILLLLLGVMLFVTSSGRSIIHTNTLVDYSVLYYSAGEYADGKNLGESTYYFSYFSHYGNNLRPMLLLSWLFKIADLMHISRFHFVLFIVCVQIVCVAWSMGEIVSTEENKVWRIPTLLLFGMLLPMWCMTAAFYTDTMSMGLCVIAVALLKILSRKYASLKEEKYGPVIFMSIVIGAALLVVLAMIWKITAMIPLIAYVIASVLSREKYCMRIFAFLIITTIGIWGICSCIFNSYNIVQDTKDSSDPLLSWVAIGMKGNGTWSENSDFVHTLHAMEETTEKLEYTKCYIEDNREHFWDINHILRKTCRNFADGNLDAGIFTPIEDDGSGFWDMYNAWGKWNWRVSQLSFCYLEVIFLSLLLGAIISLIDLHKGKKANMLLFSTHLSFLGIFVFLMIWEANSRQMYNQMPMLILGEVLFIQRILCEGAPRTIDN